MQSINQKVIIRQTIVKCLKTAINQGFRIVSKKIAIIYPDRVNKFSNQCYNNFINEFEQLIIPSMSGETTLYTNVQCSY